MRIFIDTNVLLDFLLDRLPFADEAEKIIQLSSRADYRLLMSSLSLVNIAYISRKVMQGDALYNELSMIRSLTEVTAIDEICIDTALAVKVADFEDAVQYVSAKSAHADCIITRNVKHFAFSTIPVLTPQQYLQGLG